MNVFEGHSEKYKSLGLIPFPASPGEKHPIVPWGNGIIPTDEDLSGWRKKYPAANIWVRLGEQFAVIDPDGPGAEEFVQTLNLPPCPTSISGNRSIHRWFRVSSPIKAVKATNWSDQTFLELRTGNMGMLVPPSIHPKTGKPYQWLEKHSPWDLDFPELPAETYERIRDLESKADPVMEPLQEGNFSSGSLDVKRYLDYYGITYEVKGEANRTIYRLQRCLFSDQHTTQDIRGDSAIIQGRDGKLGYHCFHNHCANRTWQDARKAISGDESIARFFVGHQSSPASDSNLRYLPTLLKKAILDADEFRKMEFPEKRRILKPWLSEQSLVLVSGARGIGKTWFALSLADAITRGTSFGPWPVITPVPCLYIDGELAIQDTQERLETLELSAQQERKESLLVLSDHYANHLGFPKGNLKEGSWREFIKTACLEGKIKLIVLDNISSLSAGVDENSKLEWDPINQWLLDLRFSGLSIILLHHMNKSGGQRGTSGREDNIDISITLEKPPGYVSEDGCRFLVKFTKQRIRTAELHLIEDTEFHLKEEDNRLFWSFGNKKSGNQIAVLRAFSDGVSQKEIPEKVSLEKGTVSKIKKRLINEGYLSPKGQITPKGKEVLNAA